MNGPSKRRGGLAAATLLSASLIVAACGGSGSDPSGDPGSGDAGEDATDPVEVAHRDAELRFAINYGFNSLDPHRSPNPLGDANWMRPVYDRLLVLADDPDGGVELAPQLATSYEVAEDGLSISFELRDDVTFQDGADFDADAVRATIERAKGPESTVATTLANLETVEVVDATHVVFHLSRPDPSVLWAMAIGTTGMMISPTALDSDLGAEPVGSGPFGLTSAQQDADVVYERWDDHWDPDAALVSQLTLSTVPDANARYNGLRSGDYDAAFLSPPHDSESEALEAEGFHREHVLSPVAYGVLLNSAEAPFDDLDVRRAVSLALDRSEISDDLLQGVNPAADQPFLEGYLGHDESLGVDYDLEEARRLVREAGAEGADVDLIQQLTAPQESLGQVAQQAMEDIGLDVEVTPLSPTEARPAWRDGSYGAMVAPLIAQAEPSQTLALSYLGGDNPAPPPPELEEMAADALVLPVDSAEREEAYQEIAAWLVDNPVHVPIAQFSTVAVTRPDVVGSENLLVQDLANFDFRRLGRR
jgi:peptide/nickel transport system substrate-binding protein